MENPKDNLKDVFEETLENYLKLKNFNKAFLESQKKLEKWRKKIERAKAELEVNKGRLFTYLKIDQSDNQRKDLLTSIGSYLKSQTRTSRLDNLSNLFLAVHRR